jgi:hypothetical protein
MQFQRLGSSSLPLDHAFTLKVGLWRPRVTMDDHKNQTGNDCQPPASIQKLMESNQRQRDKLGGRARDAIRNMNKSSFSEENEARWLNRSMCV